MKLKGVPTRATEKRSSERERERDKWLYTLNSKAQVWFCVCKWAFEEQRRGGKGEKG